MADDTTKEDNTKSTKDIKPGPNEISREIATFWKEQGEQVYQSSKEWLSLGGDIVSRFRDERSKTGQSNSNMRRMNTLWANYKILKPAIFSQCPIPIIERKFLDRDVIARLSAQLLERSTKSEIESNGLYDNISRAVTDYLLAGRGVVWARYEPEIGEGDSLPSTYQNTMEDNLGDAIDSAKDDDNPEPIPQKNKRKTEKLATTGEQLLNESVPIDYIDYRDFKFYPSKVRTWPEVQAISKKVTMSKRQCIDRFGEKIGKAMKPDKSYQSLSDSGPVSPEQQVFQDINNRNIVVEEIWNKIDRRIYWICGGYEYLCDVKDDFLELKDFFPIPMPLSSTLSNDSLVPVPDYKEYQDQALQIDELTQRIAFLTKACKVAGAYASDSDPLKKLLDEGFELQLIAVEDWAGLQERGGIEGQIYFLPIDKIQEVIRTLTEVRSQVMQDMDLITGISDVIRGTTDSRETLGGIRLKNNNAGTRLSDRQKEVARFARDTIAIVAEIQAKHFKDETLIEKSGIKLMDDMQPDNIVAQLKQGKTAKSLTKGQPPKPAPKPPIPGAAPMAGPANVPGAPPQAPPLSGAPPASPPQQMPPMPLPGPPNAGSPGMPPGMPPQMPHGGPQMPSSPGGPQMHPPMGGGLMPPGMGQPPQQPPIDPEIQAQIEELKLYQQANQIIDDKLKGALELIRDNILFFYRIDIETDSTVFGDIAQDREDAKEFLTAVTMFMDKAATSIQTMPQAMPLYGRMLQWGVRKFRTGRDLEGAIDAFIEQMEHLVKDMEDNPKPNPDEQKAQMDMQLKQQEMAHQQQLQQMEQASQQANDQRDAQKAQLDDQRQRELNAMEMQMEQQKAQLEREKMELEKQMMLLKHQLETQKMNMEAQHQERSMQMESAHQQQTMQLKSQEAQTQHGIAMQSAQQQAELANSQHQQSMEAATQKHKLGLEAQTQKHTMMKEQAAIKAKQPKGKAA